MERKSALVGSEAGDVTKIPPAAPQPEAPEAKETPRMRVRDLHAELRARVGDRPLTASDSVTPRLFEIAQARMETPEHGKTRGRKGRRTR